MKRFGKMSFLIVWHLENILWVVSTVISVLIIVLSISQIVNYMEHRTLWVRIFFRAYFEIVICIIVGLVEKLLVSRVHSQTLQHLFQKIVPCVKREVVLLTI